MSKEKNSFNMEKHESGLRGWESIVFLLAVMGAVYGGMVFSVNVVEVVEKDKLFDIFGLGEDKFNAAIGLGIVAGSVWAMYKLSED